MPDLHPNARKCLIRPAVGLAQFHQLHARDIENDFLARKLGLEFAELWRTIFSKYVPKNGVRWTLHTLKPGELVHFAGPTISLGGLRVAVAFLAVIVPYIHDVRKSLIVSVHRDNLCVGAFH